MNPSTRIMFTNGRAGGRVTLTVFDVTGRRVRQLLDEPRPVGAGEVAWDGRDDDGRSVVSGLYFVKLATRDMVQSRKLVVAK
jgi:flagellar hook assembly protein FlgD